MAAPGITWTQISNLALTRIREERLSSIDESTKNAELIRDIRSQISCEVLERHDWGTATARTTLTERAGNPVGPWEAHYDLPSDLVRITAVWPYTINSSGDENHGGPFVEDWKAEGSIIYIGTRHVAWGQAAGGTKFAIAYVRYKETDLGLWSAHLRRCIALKLACDLAVGTAGDFKASAILDKEYERSVRLGEQLDTSREGNALHQYNNYDHGLPSRGYSQLFGASSGIGTMTVS